MASLWVPCEDDTCNISGGSVVRSTTISGYKGMINGREIGGKGKGGIRRGLYD